jgi:hypothetical protein
MAKPERWVACKAKVEPRRGGTKKEKHDYQNAFEQNRINPFSPCLRGGTEKF